MNLSLSPSPRGVLNYELGVLEAWLASMAASVLSATLGVRLGGTGHGKGPWEWLVVTGWWLLVVSKDI